MRNLFVLIIAILFCGSFRNIDLNESIILPKINLDLSIESKNLNNISSLDLNFKNLKIEKIDTIADSIKCLRIPISKDVAIGYHDFFNSTANFVDAIQLVSYTIPGALGGLNQNRALFKFDISDELDTLKIVSVKLSLFATGPLGILNGHTGTKNQGILQRITKSWDENTANWYNQPTTKPDNQIILNNPMSPDQNYIDIDITELFLDLKKENYGLMLKQKDEIPTNALLFCSLDHPDSNRHPYIDVCYITNNKKSVMNDTSYCNIQYYPNPSSHKLYVKFSKYTNSIKIYTIFMV
ncbi:MAG: DNRLRE domain-containing protein [Saprospiraceae bacterium]|nr:DNRLRE domain-containing protein [Saprospiraceae bacterium]